MKSTLRRPLLRFPWLACVLLALASIGGVSLSAADSAAAAGPSGATVTGLLGLAQYAKGGGGYLPLKVGTILHSGDVVQTANGSALDLDFGKDVGIIRMLQSTTLHLAAVSNDVQLEVKGGEVLGRLKTRPGSKFRVEVPTGIAGIVQGDFRLDARGYFVLLEGTALFVETRHEGEPMAFTLKGDKPLYYSPTEHSVHPAPKELEKEVRAQFKARLPKK